MSDEKVVMGLEVSHDVYDEIVRLIRGEVRRRIDPCFDLFYVTRPEIKFQDAVLVRVSDWREPVTAVAQERTH